MSELLSNLGIDAALFGAQLINFSILLFVLYRFAYKPVLAMLEARTQKIEQGLKDAEASQKKLEEAAAKEHDVLVEAKKQAKEIIAKAEEQAHVNRDEIIANAQEESAKIIAHAQKITEEQKAHMVQEVKSEIAGLVSIALEKVIDEKVDQGKDVEIINQVINAK